MPAPSPMWERPLLISLILGILLGLSFLLLKQFFVCVAWAGILVYVSWPLYERLRRRAPPNLAAFVMTTFLFGSLLLPLLWLVTALQSELTNAFYTVTGYLREGSREVPESVARIPWLGDWLQQALDKAPTDFASFKTEIAGWIQYFRNELTKIALEFGRVSVMFALTLVTAFFFYRDGEYFVQQLRHALHILVGDRVDAYFIAIGNTTKGVLYGLVLSALAQGSMAGIGYWAAGMNAPLLLATFTTLIAMLPIPFGTTMVWSSVGLWLIFDDQAIAGIGLLIWGALVVSWVDNLVRPIVISGTARVHFLLVFFGILGGLTTFGLVGIFVGPVVLAILAAVWRQWLLDHTVPKA